MATEIVLLTPDNVQLLNNVAPDVFDDEPQPHYFQPFVEDARHIMYLAVDRQIVVGMVFGVEYFHPDKPPQLWVNELGVTPGYRRQGIGKRLMQAMVAIAKDRKCGCVWVTTEPDNVAAKACYRSVPGGAAPETCVLYEWQLDMNSAISLL